MLDEMPVLRAAVDAYRAAATAAGITWPERADSLGGQPPDLVYRLFDVDHIAEQLIWLHSQGWDSHPLLPEGGGLMPWPTDAGSHSVTCISRSALRSPGGISYRSSSSA